MEFEWDETKRLTNIEKHCVDFAEAIEMFNGYLLENEDRRRNYREQRIRAFGEANGRVIQVAYTLRDGRRRLISARRARCNERRAYYASDAGRSP